MSEVEREIENIVVSVKCGMLPLDEALEMASQAGCLREVRRLLRLKDVEA